MIEKFFSFCVKGNLETPDPAKHYYSIIIYFKNIHKKILNFDMIDS